MKTLIVTLIIAFASPLAQAGVEAVVVKKTMDDKAIVVRANGEMYLIEKGVGCLSLWRYQGKRVYVNSPGLFLGVGSNLLIPDDSQECRIWNSESLGKESTLSVDQPPHGPAPAPSTLGLDGTTSLIQKALKIIGYDLVADGVFNEKTKEALARYQASKHHPQTEAGLRLSLLSLAVDVLNKKPTPPDALPVASGLYRAAQGDKAASSSNGCVEGHWISSVMSDGQIIKLEDGSIWEVDAIDTVDSMLWLPIENVLICGNRLINTDNGEKVGAKRLK
jgi:hypothetical protein